MQRKFVIWFCVAGLLATTHNWIALFQCFAGWWCFQVEGELIRLYVESGALLTWLIVLITQAKKYRYGMSSQLGIRSTADNSLSALQRHGGSRKIK